MAFDWFRVDWAIVDHPKAFQLAADLSDPNAGWYIVRLWSWLSRYAARGQFKKSLSDDVERACGWRGDRGRLLRALADAGWLENVSDDLYEAHDWWDHQRAIVEKAEKDSARKRRSRSARVRGMSRGQSADKLSDGAGTRRDGRNVTDETKKTTGPASPAGTPAPKVKRPPDPRLPALIGLLKQVYFDATGKVYFASDGDVACLRGLLSKGDDAEIERRWRSGLSATKFDAKCGSFMQLAQRWNELGIERAAAPQRERDEPVVYREGYTRL